MLRFFGSTLGALALVACGSSSTSDTFGGAQNDSAGALTDGGADASSLAPVTPSADSGVPRASDAGAASRCERLLADVERLRSEALVCSLNVPEQKQCDQLVDDVCCKIVVTGGTQAVTNFELAVKAFKSNKCTFDCSKVQCPQAPSYVCTPMTATKGTCSQ